MKIVEKPHTPIISQELEGQIRNNPKEFKNLSNEIRCNRNVVLQLFEKGINVGRYLPSALSEDPEVIESALNHFPKKLGGSRSFMRKALLIDLQFIRFAQIILLDHPKYMRSLMVSYPNLADDFGDDFKMDPRFEQIRQQAVKRHHTGSPPVEPKNILRKSLRLKEDKVLKALGY